MNELTQPAPSSAPANGELLHAFLSGRDVPCPRCGYNLRDAAGDVCTECGTVVRLGIHPTEPVMRAWIATLVATSLGAGVGLLFLALAIGRTGLPPREFWWVMFSSWACIPIATAVAVRRRRFLRWSTGVQWGTAAGFAAIVIAMFVGLTAIR